MADIIGKKITIHPGVDGAGSHGYVVLIRNRLRVSQQMAIPCTLALSHPERAPSSRFFYSEPEAIDYAESQGEIDKIYGHGAPCRTTGNIVLD